MRIFKGLKSFILSIPSVGAGFLPLCPICLPAYGGFFSSLGIAGITYSRYLLPLMILFLAIALFSLFYKARVRRGYFPFLFGLLAAVLMILGKFVLINNLVNYIGITLLIIASLWNSWPKLKKEKVFKEISSIKGGVKNG
ncbi:hypothetical protein LCGC14_1446820 [marine sediment metagenome]|uniref:MerC domain-containing protein n=1 Tax=marine sediment metagenome TaxID=412755 RepID=A0A0F9MKX7_9ZZZZ